jgi:DNA-directed RNA polymerase subunit L
MTEQTPKRQFKHQQTTTVQPEQKIEIIPAPNDSTVATFVIHNETHTLGNSLRYILMKK